MTNPTDALRLVLVPRDPTVRMVEAAFETGHLLARDDAKAVWNSMRAASSASPLPEGGGWQDISTAPDSDHPMFVVQGFEVRTVGGVIYTSDPVCVWRNLDGSFARWKQDFAPTHWMPLPAAPTGAK